MFNAINILEALKNYIRTRGGQSAANNIAEAVNDLNSIPQGSGGDIPDEVGNAIETHGMGWTSEDIVEGFDIAWDGDTTGLDVVDESLFKVANDISGVASVADLLGATMIVSPYEGNREITEDIIETVTEDKLLTEDNKVYAVLSSLGGGVVVIALEDGILNELNFTKGVWFLSAEEMVYTSRFYKEASTQEVVHQIDQKYIPQSSGGGMVVNFTPQMVDDTITLSADKTPAEVKTAMLSGAVVGTILFPYQTEISPLGPAALTTTGLIGFGIYGINPQTLTMMYLITCDESFTEWIMYQS